MLVLWIILIAEAFALDDGVCTIKNQTIVNTPGDAVLTVFLDVHHGRYCNESSLRESEELATTIYVISTLNKIDYVTGTSLGLRVIDTCQDYISVHKQCLTITPELSCSNQYYSLGILAPDKYISVLELFHSFTDIPITYYTNENTTKPLVNILVDFVSKYFYAIDLLVTDSKVTLDLLINETNKAGICVKSMDNFEIIQSNDEAVIVIAAREEYIRSLIVSRKNSNKIHKTWIVLPLDDSDVKDIIPAGSYLITPEDYLIEDLDADGLTAHWPHLLSIGKSIIAIVQLLSDLRRQSCGVYKCSLPKFDSKLLGDVNNSKVFEVLRIPEQLHTIKYSIYQRFNEETNNLHEILSYKVNIATYNMTTSVNKTKLPNCFSNMSCVNCVNLWKNTEDSSFNNSKFNSEIKLNEKTYLKTDLGVLVFIILIICGTITSLVVAGFIIFRFFIDEVLDGNPMLTLLLIMGNIFTLHSVIPFCLNDDIFGEEYLNSRKIFVSTLSIGFVHSIMLSRSFFLAFSTGGVFISHINGYLQGLMVFFISGIQLAMSTMYFIIAPANATDVLHSPVFIALLSYNIFLLITLFGIGIMIGNVSRNYCEGKCICFTVIGLLIVWLAWIIAFPMVARDWGDVMVAGLLITTAYIVIGGIFLPRVYYMVTHLELGKKSTCQLSRKNSIRNKSRRPFYDYVLPMEGVTNTSGLHQPSNPNFYGSASPSHRRQQSTGSISSHVDQKIVGFNNFGYHPDMQETENHYVVPRVCIENSDMKKKSLTKNNTSHYAQPTYNLRAHETEYDDEDDCIETDIYLEGKRLSPSRIGPNESYPSRCSSPRLYRTEATIDEEDEEIHEQEVTKITRF